MYILCNDFSTWLITLNSCWTVLTCFNICMCTGIHELLHWQTFLWKINTDSQDKFFSSDYANLDYVWGSEEPGNRMLHAGISVGQISRMFGCNSQMIFGLKNCFWQTGSISDNQKSMHPRVKTRHQDNHLVLRIFNVALCQRQKQLGGSVFLHRQSGIVWGKLTS